MKINEVTQPSDKALFEALDPTNDTGFLTEDLVKIVRTEQAGNWSAPKNMDDFLAEMESWEKE